MKAYIDGSIQPCNPGGSMGIGIRMELSDRIETHSECWGPSKNNTNNTAEYLALKRLLEFFPTLDEDELIIFTDSELIAQQMNKRRKIGNGAYRDVALECIDLLQEIKKYANVQISWIPREENSEADALSKLR